MIPLDKVLFCFHWKFWVCRAVGDMQDTEDEAVVEESDLLAKAMVMSDGQGYEGSVTEEQQAAAAKAAKRLSLRRESVLQWLHQMVSAGESVLGGISSFFLEGLR